MRRHRIRGWLTPSEEVFRSEILSTLVRWAILVFVLLVNNVSFLTPYVGQVIRTVNYIAAGMALSNAILTGLLLWKRRFPPAASVALQFLDVGVLAVLVALTPIRYSPYDVLYFLVILSAALRFSWGASVLLSLLVAALYVGQVLLYREMIQGLPSGGFPTDTLRNAILSDRVFAYIGVGVVGGFLAQQVRRLTRQRTEEDRRARELEIVHRVALAISTTLEMHDLMERVFRSLQEVIPFSEGEITLWEGTEGRLVGHSLFTPQGYIRRRISYAPGEGYTGWMAVHRQPLWIPDVAARKDIRPREEVTFLSYLGVPLLVGDRLVGTLELSAAEKRAFRQEDLETLVATAPQIAAMLDHARRYAQVQQRLERRVRQISAIEQIDQELAGTLDLDRLIHSVLERAMEFTGADVGALLVLREQRDGLEILASQGYDEETLARYRAAPWPLDRGITGRVARTNQPALIEDVTADPDYAPSSGTARSELAVPISLEEEVLGVLNLESSRPAAFAAEDLEFARHLAEHAAIAIQNARTFAREQRRARELSALQEIALDISAELAPDRLMEAVVRRTLDLLGRPAGSLWLYDPAGDLLRCAVSIVPQKGWPSQAGHTLRPGQGPQGQAFADGKPLIIADYRTWAGNGQTASGPIGPLAAAPLFWKDQVRGVLSVAGETGSRPFSPEETEILSLLASQAAIALENARLFQETRLWAEQMALLQEVNRAITTTLDLRETMSALIAGLEQLIPHSGGEVCLYDPDRQVFESYGLHGETVHLVSADHYTLEEGYTGWIGRHRRPLLIEDCLTYTEARPKRGEALESGRLRSYIGAPMLLGERLVGTLELISDRPRAFAQEHLRLLTLVAGQAAVAIDNARLHELTEQRLHQRAAQLRALQRIGHEMNTTLLLEHNLQVLIEEAVQSTAADHGNIAMLDSSVGAFRVTSALVGYSPAEERLLKQLRFGKGRSLIDDVLRSGQAEIVADAQADPRPISVKEGTRSALSVPILYEGRVQGVLNLASTAANAFDQEHLQFAQTLAIQASLAVGNARRYQELVEQRELVSQRATQLREILDIGNTLRADLDLPEMLSQIAYGIVGSVGFGLVLFNLVSEKDPDRLERVASAGIPLDDFRRLQEALPRLSEYQALFQEKYQTSRSYFIPEEAGLFPKDLLIFPAVEEEVGAEEWHARDLLLVPMYSGAGELLGVISLGNPFDRKRPTRRVVEALEIFANQAAIAVENAQLFREREWRIAELNALNRISRAATATLDLDAMLLSIYERLAEARVLEVESFYIALYDAERQRLRFYPVVDRGVLYDAEEDAAVEGMARWVVEHREPLLLEEIAQAVEAGEVEYVSLAGWEGERTRSYLGVPMMVGQDLVGVIAAQSYRPAAYGEREKQFLLTVANQVAVAVQNARLFREREQRLAELAILNEIGRVLTSALALDELLEEVYRQVSRVFDTTNFYIALYDEAGDEWESLLDVEEGKRMPPERYKVGAGLTGHIIRNKEPLLFHTAAELEAFHRQQGITAIGRPARCWMGVPLIAADKVVGVMGIQSYQEETLYSEQDLALFSTIAAQAAIAIDNARLFQERERRITELAILNEISRVLSSTLDFETLAETVYQQASRVFDTTNFYIATYEEGAEEWEMALHLERGERQSPARYPVAAGLTGWIIRNRQPLLLHDLAENAAFHQAQGLDFLGEQARSWLGVPLIAADRVVGVMAIQSYEQEGLYSKQDLTLFSTIAAQAAIALNNARLFQERERRITELAILNEIGRTISSALDPREVTQTICHQVGRVVDTTNFYVALYDEEREEWETVLDIAQGEEQPPVRYSVQEGLTGHIIRNRQPLLFYTEEDLRRFGEENGIATIGEQAHSWLGVPMIAADRVIGVIGVESYDREGAFSQDDLAVLSTVAAQAAVAMQNARLFEETRRRLLQVNTLLEVSRDVATQFDLPTLLQSIMEAAVESVPAAERGSILLLDREAQELVRAAQIGYPGEAQTEVRLGLDEGFAGWVCREGRADIVIDAHSDPRFVLTDSTLDVRSLISAPLIGKSGLVGVINLDNRTRPGAFRQQDLEFLSGLAHQAAVAIENAHLFEEREQQARILEARVRELAALLEGTRAITSTLELQEVLETMVSVVGRQMQVATVVLWLVEGEEVRPVAAKGLPAEFLQEVRLKVGQGLTGRIAERGEILTVPDVVAEDERHRSAYASVDRQLDLHGFLGVPITYQERILGVLSVMTHEPRLFVPEEIALLTGLAEQAGVAVENARLFQERERRINELVAVNEIGRAISSTMRLDELLETIRREAGRLVDTSNFLVAFYDERHNVVSFPVYHEFGRRLEMEERVAGNGLTEYVIRQRAPVLIDGDSEAFCREHGIDHHGTASPSWLGVPLIYMDRVIGVMALQDYEHAGAYDEHHVRLLSTIANQAAVAVQNARLFTDLEESRTELEARLIQLGALQEMGQTIAGTLEEDVVIGTVLDAVTATLGFSYAVVSLVDEEAGEVRAVRGVGVSEEQVAASRKPLASSDIMADIVRSGRVEVIDGWDERLDREIFERFGHADLVRIYAPLVARGKVIGLIEAGYPKVIRTEITQDDIEVLQTFLAQASIAIDNARLFAEIRRFTEELEQMVEERTRELADEKNRLEVLHTITTELASTLDLDEILLKTMDLASQATGNSLGMVLLRDPTTAGLTCRAILDEKHTLRPGPQSVPTARSALLQQVLEKREAVRIDDLQEDPRAQDLPDLPAGVRSAAVVPLVSAEATVGAILLSHPEPGFFDEDQMRLLMTLGGEVATAIHNAELYSFINDQAQRLADMLTYQQEEASKVRAILQSIADGVLVVDREGTIIMVNPAAVAILEMPREQLEGRSTRDLPGLFEEGGIFAQESRRFEILGRFVSVASAPVVTNTGEELGRVYVMRDITREVEADRAKSEFISTVSHELRTPLTSIKGYVDLILLGSVGEISPMQRNFLDVVRANANRLVDLINDLLDISRIETGRIVLNPEPISVLDLLEEVLESARTEIARKSLSLELEVPPDLPLVHADRKRILQVLNNLVSNAYKYTREGGRVAISARCTDGFVQVDVADTGVGISEEDQKKLFTRFFRADNPLADEVGGTGLGLAISKSFVEMHGGRMWVQSELNVGSTFSFTLPLAANQAGAEEELPPKAPEVAPPAGMPHTVLVVDDEPNISALLRYHLEQAGYDVRTARRGEDALEIARREHPDLITLDIMMAGMDGFEVLEQLKADESTADIPVVVVSIVAEKEDLMAMGAVDFLPKPLDKDDLLSTIRRVLGKRKKKGTILVVDDDPDIVGWLRQVLEGQGFRVNAAADGEAALEVAAEEPPDLILLDLRLPKLDGREVISRLKLDHQTRDIPIIVITASAVDKERDRVQVLGLGAESFLTKPFTAEDLVREIRRAMQERMEATKE